MIDTDAKKVENALVYLGKLFLIILVIGLFVGIMVIDGFARNEGHKAGAEMGCSIACNGIIHERLPNRQQSPEVQECLFVCVERAKQYNVGEYE